MSGKKPVNPGGSKPLRNRAAKPKANPADKPGSGLMGWLGRQVGHVKKAVKTDVTKKPAAKSAPKTAPRPSPAPEASPPPEPRPGVESVGSGSGTIIYRDDKVEEVEHPTQPGVKLRRTIIDEVILEEKEKKGE